ncbi:terpene synthase family protein [Actinomadura sp. GTD37]|uniref:terpene synthase family protein n=1 Tax=Actinomadura sp. GTD37 TaxID=1778030 RepID=UPI0035C226CF
MSPQRSAAEDLTAGLDLPPVFCPLESAINPACRAVERRAVDWLDGVGLCADARERAKAIGTHSAEFYSRFAPHADEDRLLPAVLWVYWGFAFDDARCDAGHYSARPAEFVPMASRVQRALERPGPAAGDDRYAAAVHDIGARFRKLASPVQFQRFVAAHRAWLAGVAWQVANQARGHMPDLEDYLTMRLHSAGGEPTFAMLEIAGGSEVPAAEMELPAMRALTEMAIAVTSLDNDRHSLSKELGERHASQNVYSVLLRHNGDSLTAAVQAAAGLRDRVLLRFMDLRQRLTPRLSMAGRGYVDGLAYGIRGNAEWGLRVPRYLVGDTAAAGEIAWAERPADDSPEPVPLPTIAWWWDV